MSQPVPDEFDDPDPFTWTEPWFPGAAFSPFPGDPSELTPSWDEMGSSAIAPFGDPGGVALLRAPMAHPGEGFAPGMSGASAVPDIGRTPEGIAPASLFEREAAELLLQPDETDAFRVDATPPESAAALYGSSFATERRESQEGADRQQDGSPGLLPAGGHQAPARFRPRPVGSGAGIRHREPMRYCPKARDLVPQSLCEVCEEFAGRGGPTEDECPLLAEEEEDGDDD